MAFRDSSSVSANSSSLNIPIPATAVAGDFAIIFADFAFAISPVGGWTTLYLTSGLSTWDQYAASKNLSSTDITIGHITVTSGGTFQAVG